MVSGGSARWERLKAIFLEALETPESERSDFLARACAGDAELEAELVSLLASERAAGDFFEVPAAGVLGMRETEAGSGGEAALRRGSGPRFEAGARLGAYEITGFLAAGGMGEVYRARHTVLGREVAIKTVSPALTDEASKRRLIREARHASVLGHPNICTIHEVGEAGDTPFIVMQFVDGRPLNEVVRAGLPPLAEALGWGVQLADALDHAHRHEIVHRDLKSGNVVIDSEGRPVVLDFGLARRVAREPDGPVADPTVTVTGVLAGTLSHMAPEVLVGGQADARSDIWSLGVLLYELATGELPFQGRTPFETTSAILNEAPRPLGKRVPRALRLVVERCLVKDPHARFQRAADVRDALDAIRRRHALPVVTRLLVSVRWRKRAVRDYGTVPAAMSMGSEPALPLESRAAAAGEHRMAGPSRRRRALAGLIAMPVLLFAGGLLYNLGTRRAATSPTTVAVLPCAVRGDESLAYLSEGMVALLGDRLDGAGSLRAVDARAVLALVADERAATLGPRLATRISERAGAGLFVLCDLTEVSGQLQLSASLYDVRARARPVARASTQGDTEDVLALVDRLAAGLLAGGNAAPAGISTSSFPALKAYLEGEREFRAGRAEAAVEALKRAVAADTAFALGYYRLSIAAEWAGYGDLVQWAAQEARRHAGALLWQDRLLIEAHNAFLRGDGARAEGHYRTILGNYPDNVEAWYRLGEVLFHLGPRQGRPVADARLAFERVLGLAGEDAASLVHLARIAAMEGEHALLDRTVRRALALPLAPGGRLELEALQAFARRDGTAQQRVLALLRDANDPDVMGAVWVVDVYSNNLADAPRLARLLTDPKRAPNVRALGHVMLAHLELARGRWRAAREELRRLESLSFATALEYRGLFLALPFLPLSGDDVAATRAALERWDAAVEADAVPRLSLGAHDGMHPYIRLLLMGLLDLRLGERERAGLQALELERLGAGEGAGSVATELAMGLRALLLRDRGDTARMFALLDTIEVNLRQELVLDSPFLSHVLERYLRAETHAALGQHADALRWFASFAALSSYDLPFVAPSHLRRAQIHDLIGDEGNAAEHYARFIEMWKDADPELQATVEAARARLQEMLR